MEKFSKLKILVFVMALLLSLHQAFSIPSIEYLKLENVKIGGTLITGIYNVTYEVYDASSGGTQIYTQNWAQHNITSGESFLTINESKSSLNYTKSYWRQITINGTTYTRQAIGSMPSSFEANNTRKFMGRDFSEFQLALSVGLGLLLSGQTVSLNTSFSLPTTCSNGQIAEYNTTSKIWDCANDDSAASTDTTTNTTKIDVQGTTTKTLYVEQLNTNGYLTNLTVNWTDIDTTYSALSEFTNDVGFVTNATMNRSIACDMIDGATSNLCTIVDTTGGNSSEQMQDNTLNSVTSTDKSLIVYYDDAGNQLNLTINDSSISITESQISDLSHTTDTNTLWVINTTDFINDSAVLGLNHTTLAALYSDSLSDKTTNVTKFDIIKSGSTVTIYVEQLHSDGYLTNLSDSFTDSDTTYTSLSEFANNVGFFSNLTNFTGAMTNGQICIYDNTLGVINCTYTDVDTTDPDTNITITKAQFTGTSTKTLNIEQTDHSGSVLTNITATFTDIDTTGGNSSEEMQDSTLNSVTSTDKTIIVYYDDANNQLNLTANSTYLDDNYVGQNEYPNLDTDSTNDITTSNIGNQNVNSSNYWDSLDTPSDINSADITDDNTYLTVAGDTWAGNFLASLYNLTGLGFISSSDWTNVSITESQISDLSHTTDTNTLWVINTTDFINDSAVLGLNHTTLTALYSDSLSDTSTNVTKIDFQKSGSTVTLYLEQLNTGGYLSNLSDSFTDSDTTYSALSEFTNDVGFVTNATMNRSIACDMIDGATSNLCTIVDTTGGNSSEQMQDNTLNSVTSTDKSLIVYYDDAGNQLNLTINDSSISITESQISDLSHTVDTDTNASSVCSTNQYLDGDGNCIDVIEEAEMDSLGELNTQISAIVITNSSTGVWDIQIDCNNITGGSDSDYCVDADSGGGNTSGQGTTNTIAKFSDSANITDSSITDDGTDITMTNPLTITNQGSGAVSLTLNTERAWEFVQNGTGVGSQLWLRSKVDDKQFRIVGHRNWNETIASFSINGGGTDSINLVPDSGGTVTIGAVNKQATVNVGTDDSNRSAILRVYGDITVDDRQNKTTTINVQATLGNSSDALTRATINWRLENITQLYGLPANASIIKSLQVHGRGYVDGLLQPCHDSYYSQFTNYQDGEKLWNVNCLNDSDGIAYTDLRHMQFGETYQGWDNSENYTYHQLNFQDAGLQIRLDSNSNDAGENLTVSINGGSTPILVVDANSISNDGTYLTLPINGGLQLPANTFDKPLINMSRGNNRLIFESSGGDPAVIDVRAFDAGGGAIGFSYYLSDSGGIANGDIQMGGLLSDTSAKNIGIGLSGTNIPNEKLVVVGNINTTGNIQVNATNVCLEDGTNCPATSETRLGNVSTLGASTTNYLQKSKDGQNITDSSIVDDGDDIFITKHIEVNTTADNETTGVSIFSNLNNSHETAVLNVQNKQPGHTNPIIRSIDNSSHGFAVNLYVEGGQADIEFIESDQTSPDGKFEINANNNLLNINSRDDSDTTFENVITIPRRDDTGDIEVYKNFSMNNNDLLDLNNLYGVSNIGDSSSTARLSFFSTSVQIKSGDFVPDTTLEDTLGNLNKYWLVTYSNTLNSSANLTLEATGDVLFDGTNVGIGTTTPNEKLVVVGNINTTGNIQVNATNVCLEDGTNCPATSETRLGNVSTLGASTTNYLQKSKDGQNITDSQVVDDGSTVGITRVDAGSRFAVFVDNTENLVGMYIQQNDTTNDPRALSINNYVKNYALKLNQYGEFDAINFYSEAENRTVVGIEGYNKKLSTVKIDNNVGQTAGGVLAVFGNNASRTSGVVQVTNNGTGQGIKVNQNGRGLALDLQSQSNDTSVLNIVADNEAGSIFKIKNNAAQTLNEMVLLWQANTSSTANILKITEAGTGPSIFVDQNGNTGVSDKLGAVVIDNDGNSGTALEVYMNRNTATGRVLRLKQDHASASFIVQEIINDGTGTALSINNNGAGYGILVDNGEVGIGTTTPNEKLVVSGGNLNMSSGNITDVTAQFFYNASGVAVGKMYVNASNCFIMENLVSNSVVAAC